jgi:pimeloyl-ACP methyl ester carboxylesterase
MTLPVVRSFLRVLSLAALALSLGGVAAYPQNKSQPRPSPLGDLVDVGGHRLHLYCTGKGSPTVVFEAGAGDFSFDWSLVQTSLAQVTHVCSYDRAGYAWSEPGPTPRTIRQTVAELNSLLRNAHLAAPYVLVGHSLGGLYVRAYASEHPAEVAGVVLIEAASEDNPIMLNGQVQLLRSMSRGRTIPPVQMGAIAKASGGTVSQPQASAATLSSPYDKLPADVQRIRVWAMQAPDYGAARSSEFDYLPEELAELHAQRARGFGSLGDLPIVILTRKDAPSDHAARQRDLLSLSRNSKQEIAATADHHVQLADPGAVLRAVNDVLRTVRQRTPLNQLR